MAFDAEKGRKVDWWETLVWQHDLTAFESASHNLLIAVEKLIVAGTEPQEIIDLLAARRKGPGMQAAARAYGLVFAHLVTTMPGVRLVPRKVGE